jgi:hypothetical protein
MVIFIYLKLKIMKTQIKCESRLEVLNLIMKLEKMNIEYSENVAGITANVEAEKIRALKVDIFTAHAYLCTSSFGGYEMEVSNCGDGVRLRDTHTNEIFDWQEITYNFDTDTHDDTIPVFKHGDGHYCLNEFMRID